MGRHAEPSGEPGDPSRHRRRAPATGPQRRCRRRSFHGARLKLETGFVWNLWGNSFLDHEGLYVLVLQSAAVPVSVENSRIVYNGLKRSGVKIVSALPETWLVHLINIAGGGQGTTLFGLG